MNRIREFLEKNWIPLTAGFLLTAWGVRSAYVWRGYAAVGSEWLILPFTVFCFQLGEKFCQERPTDVD